MHTETSSVSASDLAELQQMLNLWGLDAKYDGMERVIRIFMAGSNPRTGSVADSQEEAEQIALSILKDNNRLSPDGNIIVAQYKTPGGKFTLELLYVRHVGFKIVTYTAKAVVGERLLQEPMTKNKALSEFVHHAAREKIYNGNTFKREF